VYNRKIFIADVWLHLTKVHLGGRVSGGTKPLTGGPPLGTAPVAQWLKDV